MIFWGINAIPTAIAPGDPMDDAVSPFKKHGTGVASIIGALGNDGVGMCGINWKAQIMALKFMDTYGTGTVSGALTCINYVLAMQAREGYPRIVLNCSWGTYNYSNALYCALKTAGDNGILFVAAVGNDGKNTDSCPVYPASYNLDNIISVAASDCNDKKASFSNYGPASVDLFAPGKDIMTAQANGYCGFYNTISSTSMAAAHVSGACGLVWSNYPDLDWKGVKGLILNGAVDGVTAPNDFAQKCLTQGRLNLNNALSLPTATPAVFSVTPAQAIAGESITLTGINFGDTPGTLTFQGQSFPTDFAAANIKSWSNEQIVATMPTGLDTGYGKLVVTVGGLTSRGACFANAPGERLVGQTAIPRGKAASAQSGSYVWILGGETSWGVTGLVEKYTLSNGNSMINSAWMMPIPVSNAGAAAISGKIYVVGGYGVNGCYDQPKAVNNLQIFDTVAGKWTSGAPLPKALIMPTVVAYSGKIYVFGGVTVCSGTTPALSVAYVYDPAANTWTAIAAPKATAGAAGALSGTGKIWVMGGYSSITWSSGDYSGIEQKAVQQYDPVANTWSAITDLTFPRAGAAGINYGSKVFCVHGSGSGLKGRTDGERYLTASKTWKADITGTQALFGPAVGVYSGKIYLLGGLQVACFSSCCGGKYSSNVWAFKIP